jgi:hypothetical protein
VDLAELLELIRKRGPVAEGIGLASHYAAGLAPCLADGACQVDFFRIASPKEWAEMIDKAAKQLVYSDADLVLTDGVRVAGAGPVMQTGAKKLASPRPGACMSFECVVTTTKEDRDKDVLETEGADLDPRAPLLWQHIPMLPIGTVDAETDRSSKRMKAAASIIDNAQGNDAAQLVEFGALRISHGFIPLEFEPRDKKPKKDDDGGMDPFPGWHVKKFKILEVSLVSIPSNEDAVITALSRAKLAHPLIKAWAQHLLAKLPSQVISGWGEPLRLAAPTGCKCGGTCQSCRGAHGKGKETDPNGKCPECGGQMKDGKCPDCGYDMNKGLLGDGDPNNGECPVCGGKVKDGKCEKCGYAGPAKAATDEHKCPDCDVKFDEDGRCPKCGKEKKSFFGVPVKNAGKPYPNEHSCRLLEPAKFEKDSFRRSDRKHEGKTYSVIMGKLKGQDSMTEQAYRYPKDDWTPAEAKSHCKGHDGGTFEPASDTSTPAPAAKGRLPKRTMNRLEEAEQLGGVVKKADELKAHTRASAARMHGLLVEVLAEARADTGGAGGEPKPEAGATAEALAGQLLGRLLGGERLSAGSCDVLARKLAEVRPGAAALDAEEALRELLAV